MLIDVKYLEMKKQDPRKTARLYESGVDQSCAACPAFSKLLIYV
jgi:hypothetical protein